MGNPLAIQVGLDVASSIAEKTGKYSSMFKGGQILPKELQPFVGGAKRAPKGGVEVRIPSNNPLQQHLAGMESANRPATPLDLVREARAGGNRGPIQPETYTVKQSKTNLDLARQRILEDLPGPRAPGYDPNTKSYGSVEDYYSANGSALQRERFVGGTPPSSRAPTPAVVQEENALKATAVQSSNNATAGSEVSSTKAAGISGYNLDRNPMTTLLTAGAGGLMGGAISYASGGEFSQGALAGTMGGLAMRAGGHVLNSNKELAGKMSTGLQSATSAFVDNNRQAMLAGAGLTGFVFGGKRESKKRGFNSSRGNGF